MALTISHTAKDYKVQRVLICAKINGVAIDFQETKGGEPTLTTPEGNLTGALTSARYVAGLRADTNLLGSCYFMRSSVDAWCEYNATSIEPPRNAWFAAVNGIISPDAVKDAKNKILAALKFLDAHFLHHTFFGQRLSLADISVACTLADMFRELLAPYATKSCPNVLRWFKTVINQPAVAEIVGEVVFCTKEKQAPKPKPVEKPKPKVAEKPKEKQTEGDDEDAPKKPKVVNPLDLLPPSRMVFDVEKKSFFSVQPFNREFFKTFWTDIYDPQGYCIYFANYNYNEENTVLFMTANLVGGWLQRLDTLRKYGFGVVLLTGANEDTPPFKMKSCWMFRGQGIPPEMSEGVGSDQHTFTVADVSTPKDRARVESYFQGEVVDDGETILERRFYK
jgi:elongation factor 1-gamma